MEYEFTAVLAPRFLHVIGRGAHTPDNLRRFLLDSYQAALEHQCDTVLMELRFLGSSLSIGSIYSVIAERSRDGSRLRHIACVDTNAEHSHDRAEFAEMAACRLGVSVRFFANVEDARRSLCEL